MTTPDPTSTNYLESVRSQVPLYDELQDAAIAAVPFAPGPVLELGIGTGQTSARLLERHPEARITGLDSDPEMVYRAREQISDVSLARMEDPLPDGPWDLIISVLSIHRLTDDQKQTLFRRARQNSKALVIGDFVALPTGEGRTMVDGTAYPGTAEHLADWAGGKIAWAKDDLVVVVADYR
ncbi:MAG: class I SAM-dependent methyltransferase [Actinomycetota bacterium]|nr:class I SAM-dependent methyltransferase [Actinomycetota bacterium]